MIKEIVATTVVGKINRIGDVSQMKLSQQTIGRLRASYQRLESALKSQNVPSEEIAQRINNRKSEDCLTYDISTAELDDQIASLKVATTPAGKVAMRKLHYRVVEANAKQSIAIDNTIIATDWGKVDLSTMRAFLVQAQETKKELAHVLHTTEWTTSPQKGYCHMVFSPCYNPNTHEEINDQKLLYLMVGDWDPDRSYHKYGCRMVPGGEATWFEPVSFELPEPVAIPYKETKQQKK